MYMPCIEVWKEEADMGSSLLPPLHAARMHLSSIPGIERSLKECSALVSAGSAASTIFGSYQQNHKHERLALAS